MEDVRRDERVEERGDERVDAFRRECFFQLLF